MKFFDFIKSLFNQPTSQASKSNSNSTSTSNPKSSIGKTPSDNDGTSGDDQIGVRPKSKTDPFFSNGFVFYGIYPQRMANQSLVTLLNSMPRDENGYVKYEDNLYYCEDKKWFITEPIRWRILSREGNKVLLISEYVLDAYRFSDGFTVLSRQNLNDYGCSAIREWLNNTFLSRAFPDGGKFLTPPLCRDKITLPTVDCLKESKFGFVNNENRKGRPTSFVTICNPPLVTPKEDVYAYWTSNRVPLIGESENAVLVLYNGGTDTSSVYYEEGVRPLIKLDLSRIQNKKENEHESLSVSEKSSFVSGEKAEKYSPHLKDDVVLYGEYPHRRAKISNEKELCERRGENERIVEYEGKRYCYYRNEFYLFEPIRWKILERKDNEFLLISESILDVRRFDGGNIINDFFVSEICAWLNGTFLSTAFPDGGSALISNNKCKVFLPQKDYLENKEYGFCTKINRKGKATDYVSYQGVGTWSQGRQQGGKYWTLTPDPSFAGSVYSVFPDGSFTSQNTSFELGIRPCIRIKID